MTQLIYNGVSYPMVQIDAIPANINTNGVQKQRCTDNTKLVINNNPDSEIKYIEGILMTYALNAYQAIPHAWCKTGDLYFDPSAGPDMIDYWFGYCPFREVPLNEIPDETNGFTPFSTMSREFLAHFKNLHPIIKL